MPAYKKNRGFTLLEIMLALALGLIVIGGALSIYILTVSSSSDIIKSSRLNYDLDSVMQLMLNDIRRAGYWGGASDGVATLNYFTNANAGAGAITNIRILNGNCILYSYDADGNGADEDPNNLGFDMAGNVIVIVNANELYGFKLEDNSIKIRSSGTVTNDCDDGNWEHFIDEDKLTITNLQFSFESIDAMANGNSRCWNQTQKDSDDVDPLICTTNAVDGDYIIQNRMVNIKLSGEVINDADVVKDLSGTVEVRNNRICQRSAAENCP